MLSLCDCLSLHCIDFTLLCSISMTPSVFTLLDYHLMRLALPLMILLYYLGRTGAESTMIFIVRSLEESLMLKAITWLSESYLLTFASISIPEIPDRPPPGRVPRRPRYLHIGLMKPPIHVVFTAVPDGSQYRLPSGVDMPPGYSKGPSFKLTE